jgi:hypothetical protein
MFVSVAEAWPDAREATPTDLPDEEGPGATRAALSRLAERVRPITSSRSRLLPVLPPLAGLFPGGGLQRGSTIVVSGGPGAFSLAMAVVAAASATGSWCAFAGVGDFGAVAAFEVGIDLERLSLVPSLGVAWAEVTAALLDGVDLVVLRPPFPPRPTMVRRLVARARERRSVLVVLPDRAGWPEHPDLCLTVAPLRWDGAGKGDGYLRRRHLVVTATGRRGAGRPRHSDLWLPSEHGAVTTTTDSAGVA